MATVHEHARAGLAALEDKKFDDAIASFRAALELEPDRPDMNHALGMAHLHRGDAGNAIEHLARAVELAEPFDHPDNQDLKREFHYALADAHQVMDQIGAAIQVLQGMIDRWPDASRPRLQLGRLLLQSCRLEEGLAVYRDLQLEGDDLEAIEALIGSIRAFQESDADALVFLEGHRASYVDYFDSVEAAQAGQGWLAEAERLAVRDDGEKVPMLAEGARPYALSRVDFFNPADGTASSVYSDVEPMVVAVRGFEPLAQVAVLLPLEGNPFEVFVSSRCPWHWLDITVQFREAGDPETLLARLDEVIGDWYLSGYNGDFGTRERGRFHYVTDPEPVGDRALSYVVDLGRAGFDATRALLHRLTVLHDRHPIERVVFGQGRLPE